VSRTGEHRHERGVLDTSTLILLSRLEDATALPAEPLITAITLAELSVGPLVVASPTERAARQAHVQQAEADFDPLHFDAAAASAFGRVAASLRQSGQACRARIRRSHCGDGHGERTADLHVQPGRFRGYRRSRSRDGPVPLKPYACCPARPFQLPLQPPSLPSPAAAHESLLH
jgi:predicted nucleic acid-binding protein